MKRKEELRKGADTVKEWMEAHPQEYARFAAKMKTEGIGGVLKLGEDAFRLSPDFQQEVERIVTTGRFDVSSLLEHLALSDFAENYLREKNEDHMAMAAWVKYESQLRNRWRRTGQGSRGTGQTHIQGDAFQPVQAVLGEVLSAGRTAPQMPGSGRKGSIYGRKFPAHACLEG